MTGEFTLAKLRDKDIYDSSWGNIQLELRAEIKNWIKNAIRRQAGIPWRGGHDEARYTCEWGNYYRLSGEESVKKFLLWLRDSYREWSSKNHYHGFQTDANEHSNHSFENAEEFLVSLCNFAPEDSANWDLIEDIAHHVGNWVEGIPDWYDWKRHKFVSHWLGTKNVKNYPPYDFGLAGHARIGTIVLYAYKHSHDERYLEWCKDYLDNWFNIIMESKDRIPMVAYPRDLKLEESMRIYNFGRERCGDPYIGNLWAYNIPHVINFMLQVFAIIKEPKYLEASRKAIEICRKCLVEDSQEDRLLDIYMTYQEITGEDIYQHRLEQWYQRKIFPALKTEQQIPDTLIITRKKGRRFGFWHEDIITPYKGPTSTMFLDGYKISGNFACMKRAMALAAKELSLVTYSTRDGREHGCASHKFIHGCGEEAASALNYSTGIDKISYYKEDGSLGLDEEIAVMADIYHDETPVLYFYNKAKEHKTVKLGFKDPNLKFSEMIVEGNRISHESSDLQVVELRQGEVSKVEIGVAKERL